MGLKITTGNYLKHEEVSEDGEEFVIETVKEEEMPTQDGSPGETRFVLYLENCKPLVLNKTNTRRATAAFGSNDLDDWVGKSIIVYSDPEVEYAGNVVGGVRLRAVPRPVSRGKKKATTTKKKRTNGAGEDDVPF
jgi:hypothetical protein